MHDVDTACQTSRLRAALCVGGSPVVPVLLPWLQPAGRDITSSALDSVGQPGYGPVVSADGGSWDRWPPCWLHFHRCCDSWLRPEDKPETATGIPQADNCAANRNGETTPR